MLGDADVYAHSGGQYEWDSAAPVGVAAAAGLHVSRLDGAPLVYNRPEPWLPDLLICRPELRDAVLAVTRRSAQLTGDEEHREPQEHGAERGARDAVRQLRSEAGGRERRWDHPERERAGDRPVDVAEQPVRGHRRDGQCGRDHQRGARGARRGEAERHHEDRHEQDAAAGGEEPGDEPRRRRQRDDQAGPVAPGGATLVAVAPAGTTIRMPTPSSSSPEAMSSH